MPLERGEMNVLYVGLKKGFNKWAKMNPKNRNNPTAHHLRCFAVSPAQWNLINALDSHTNASRQIRINHVNERMCFIAFFECLNLVLLQCIRE